MRKILSVLISLLCINGYAQENRNINCAVCVEGLKTAAFNTFSLTSESEFKSFLSMYFSMTDEQRKAFRNSSSTSAGLKAVIDAIPVGFTGSNSTATDREEYKRLEIIFKENQEVYSSDLVKIYSKIVDASAVRAYENCITNCIQQSGAESALAYMIEGDINDEFVLIINWRPTNALTTSRVASFEFPGLMLKNGANIFNGADFKAFTAMTQSFKRTDPSKTAAITVSFVGLGQPIRITLDPVDKLSNILPLGTIVASTLNYEQFSGSIFSDEKSIWSPADGRSVAKSKYGKINSNVPDLRGQFLRGFNQFHSPGQPNSIVNGAAPEGDRFGNNGYSYQKDALKSHEHSIKDPGHEHNVAGLGQEGAQNGGNNGGARQCCFQGDPLPLKAVSSITNITVQASGGLETRPNNIAVFYYIKIN